MTKLAQLLEIAKRELKEEIKSGKRPLNEAKTFKVNPKYAYFAVGKSDNKIVNGWEIVGDVESLKYHAKDDLKDMDLNPSDFKLVSKDALKKQGIDPFNWNSWRKNEVSEDVIIKTQDGTSKTLTQAQKDQINSTDDTVDIQKSGSNMSEAKKDKEGEEAPVEEEQPVEQPADDQGSLSAKLGEHISAAIDAAADCIQNTDDKKYETTLGKVVKNLTAAQAALEVVAAHETKLAEEAGVLRDKSLKKYVDAFKKQLKKVIKDDTLIEKIIKIYKKVIETSHDKEVPAEKMTEQVWKHFTLNESIQRKAGVMLNESIEDSSSNPFKEFIGKKLKGESVKEVRETKSGITISVGKFLDKNSFDVHYKKGLNRIIVAKTSDEEISNNPKAGINPKTFGFSKEDVELILSIIKEYDPSTKLTPDTITK